MVIVRLSDWQEFLDEVRSDNPSNGVVRLTLSARRDAGRPSRLYLVAGFFSGSQIVEFAHYLGPLPGEIKSDRSKEIEALFTQRKRELEGLGLLVRPGRYHAPPDNYR